MNSTEYSAPFIPCLLLFSGEIASGKTTIAKNLEDRYNFIRIGTGTYLQGLLGQKGLDVNRENLQKLGDELDDNTKGRWAYELVKNEVSKFEYHSNLVFDSVRRDFQISVFRQEWSGKIVHVHFRADAKILHDRFAERAKVDNRDSKNEYGLIKENSTEAQVSILSDLSDISINTGTVNQDICSDLIGYISSKIFQD